MKFVPSIYIQKINNHFHNGYYFTHLVFKFIQQFTEFCRDINNTDGWWQCPTIEHPNCCFNSYLAQLTCKKKDKNKNITKSVFSSRAQPIGVSKISSLYLVNKSMCYMYVIIQAFHTYNIINFHYAFNGLCCQMNSTCANQKWLNNILLQNVRNGSLERDLHHNYSITDTDFLQILTQDVNKM